MNTNRSVNCDILTFVHCVKLKYGVFNWLIYAWPTKASATWGSVERRGKTVGKWGQFYATQTIFNSDKFFNILVYFNTLVGFTY